MFTCSTVLAGNSVFLIINLIFLFVSPEQISYWVFPAPSAHHALSLPVLSSLCFFLAGPVSASLPLFTHVPPSVKVLFDVQCRDFQCICL